MHTTHDIEKTRRPSRRVFGLLGVLAIAIAIPVRISSASFTSQSKNTGSVSSAVDWTPPTVTLTDPGDGIRGTVTLTAQASDNETGIAQVSIAWAPAGTSTWTTLCTRTAAPYTCAFNTSGLPEDYVDLRAIAVDKAGYSTTALVIDVLVDNVAPTGSLGAIASPISGVVTINATATDAGSGVASVRIEYAPNGTTSWTELCTDTTSPYSCRFDSTTVADGAYSFRAIITDVAGNVTTTATITNRQVDNRSASVSVDEVPPFLRATETISASAFSPAGVTSVRIQRMLAGTNTWVDICTDTTAPYSCLWDTTTVADGSYTFRAILVDGNGQTTTSPIAGPSRVDNSAVRGLDVQTTNGGATIGKFEANDAITFTYSEVLNPASLITGWTGGSQSVVLRLRDGGLLTPKLSTTDDTIDVFTTAALSTPVNLGSVNLKGDYVKGGKVAVFSATITAATVTVNGQPATAVTVKLGALLSGSGIRTTGGSPYMVWTPSAAATDTAGNKCSTAPATETGAADRDF